MNTMKISYKQYEHIKIDEQRNNIILHVFFSSSSIR